MPRRRTANYPDSLLPRFVAECLYAFRDERVVTQKPKLLGLAFFLALADSGADGENWSKATHRFIRRSHGEATYVELRRHFKLVEFVAGRFAQLSPIKRRAILASAMTGVNWKGLTQREREEFGGLPEEWSGSKSGLMLPIKSLSSGRLLSALERLFKDDELSRVPPTELKPDPNEVRQLQRLRSAAATRRDRAGIEGLCSYVAQYCTYLIALDSAQAS